MATTEKKIHFYKISDGIPESNGTANPVDILSLLSRLFEIENTPCLLYTSPSPRDA